jgi:hypothetical protein
MRRVEYIFEQGWEYVDVGISLRTGEEQVAVKYLDGE